MGGKNAGLVFDDVDPEEVAVDCVRAAFVHCGQLCLSLSRFYVHSAIYKKFLSLFKEHTHKAARFLGQAEKGTPRFMGD